MLLFLSHSLTSTGRMLDRTYVLQTKNHSNYQMQIQIGQAINRFGSRDLRWSKEGMLRIEMDLMRQFFMPTLEKIKQVLKELLALNAVAVTNSFQHVNAVFSEPDIDNLTHLFLVGGFAESTLLQVFSRITILFTLYRHFTPRISSARHSLTW